MPQSLAALYCHIIFSTKQREPLIPDTLAPDLYAYIGGIFRERKCALIAAGGVEDHVHLLGSLSRETAVADLVRDVKANSSRWIHETRPGMNRFAWQTGYGVFSVSESQLDAVKGYLARQREHHRKQSFQDEYRNFLQKHGIAFDEQYVWD